jgi:Ca2+-binding RTX toxin-like protein
VINGDLGNDNINGEDGNDVINGGAGYDTLYGGTGDDIMDGGADNDFMTGDNGNDTLNGGSGEDRIFGGLGDDAIFGDDGNDVMSGQDGNDTLNGGAGDDTLYGGAGKDVLTGSTGNDTLFTGQGSDILTGGAGCDFFNFESPIGRAGYNATTVGTSIITDFTNGQDLIGLSAGLFGSFGYYGQLHSADFATVKNQAEYDAAACGSAKIIYNSANGSLFFNANGAEAGLGNGSQFATVQNCPTLTISDFQVQW